MRRTAAFLIALVAVSEANPILVTIMSEVCVDPADQWIELHSAPVARGYDLTGYTITTATSVCTLSYVLQSGEYLVVDSSSLAQGTVGHGKFRLNPEEESITLRNLQGMPERICYPRYPTGGQRAPVPPEHGSISLWNNCDAVYQSMNWYVDSSPTPGAENDDFSVIAGTVTGSGGDTLDTVCVIARGQNGYCSGGGLCQTSYSVGGLGAGKYEVTAEVQHRGHRYVVTYPESVAVGYSQTVGGIDVVIPVPGVTEAPPASVLPLLRVSGRTLLLGSDGSAPVMLALYNHVGSRVSATHLGRFTGERRVQLPATLPPGIYFATAQKGTRRSTVKVVLW